MLQEQIGFYLLKQIMSLFEHLKVSDPTGAKHFALFNRACLSIIKQRQGKKDSMTAKRQGAAWNGDFRAELLFD